MVALERIQGGKRNRLLATLPAADLALLTPYLKDISMEQGDLLQEQGDPVEEVYFPQMGSFRCSR